MTKPRPSRPLPIRIVANILTRISLMIIYGFLPHRTQRWVFDRLDSSIHRPRGLERPHFRESNVG